MITWISYCFFVEKKMETKEKIRIFLKINFDKKITPYNVQAWISYSFEKRNNIFLIKQLISHGNITLLSFFLSKITSFPDYRHIYSFFGRITEKKNTFRENYFDLKQKKKSNNKTKSSFGEKKGLLFWVGSILEKNRKNVKKYYCRPLFHEKDSLWNDLFSFFLNLIKNFGSKKTEFKIVSLFAVITEALWILDGQYDKFWKRKMHGGRIFLPSLFFTISFSKRDYINLWRCDKKPSRQKIFKKRNKLLKGTILRKFSKIIKIFFNQENFLWGFDWDENFSLSGFNNLPETFTSYAEYNEASLERTEKNHLRKETRNIRKFMTIKTLESRLSFRSKKKIIEETKLILEQFKILNNYIRFDLYFFLPFDKYKRANSIETLNLPFSMEILEYFPGGNRRKVVICWKIPNTRDQRSIIKKNFIIIEEMKRFPIFYSRKMLRSKKNILV